MNAPTPPELSAAPAPRRRRSSAWLWVALSVGLFGLVLAGVVVGSLLYLESNSGRATIMKAARDQGFPIAFDRLLLRPLRGQVQVSGLRIEMPAPHAHVAKSLLAIDRIELAWSTSALLRGHLHVQNALITGVRAHMVVDEEGRDSLALALAHVPKSESTSPEEPPSPAGPRSHTLANIKLPVSVQLDAFALTDVHAKRTTLMPGGRVVREEFGGIEIHAHATLNDRVKQAELLIASPERAQGTQLVIEDSGAEPQRRVLEVRVSQKLTLDQNDLHLNVTAELLRQTFEEALPLTGRLIELRAQVRFSPKEALTRLALERFAVLGDVLFAEFALAWHDNAPLPQLESGRGNLWLDPLAKLLPPALGTLTSHDARATFKVTPPAASASAGALAHLQASGRAKQLAFATANETIALDAAEFELDANVGPAHVDLTLNAPFGRITVRSPQANIELADTAFSLRLADLDLVQENLMASTGMVATGLQIKNVELAAPGTRLAVADLRFDFSLPLSGKPAFDPKLHLSLAHSTGVLPTRERIQVGPVAFDLAVAQLAAATPAMEPPFRFSAKGSASVAGLGKAMAKGAFAPLMPKGALDWQLDDVVVDPNKPEQARAGIKLAGNFAPLSFSLQGSYADASGDGNVEVSVASFTPLLTFLDAETRKALAPVNLQRASLALKARGAWAKLLSPSPRMDHELQLDLRQLGYAKDGMQVQVPHVGLALSHEARAGKQQGRIRLALANAMLNGQLLDPEVALEIKASFDPVKRKSAFESRLGYTNGFALTANIDANMRPDGALEHTESVTVAGLAGLVAALPPALRQAIPLQLERLKFALSGKGSAKGLLRPDLSGLAQEASTEAHFTQTLEAKLEGVHYDTGDIKVAMASAGLALEGEGNLNNASARLRVQLPQLEFEDLKSRINVHDFQQTVSVQRQGNTTTLEVEGKVDRVEQDVAPLYLVEDVALSARLRLDGDDIALERFTLTNARGGTTLELQKTLNRPGANGAQGPAGLALKGNLSQDLTKLDGDPKTLTARGRMSLPFSVYSADGSLYRLQAMVELDDVTLALPQANLTVAGLSARVPLEEAIEVTPENGVVIVPFTERNVFSRARFLDLQPFLSSNNLLRIDSIKWGEHTLGPVMGSLRVDRNVFAIDKIKIQKGEALVAGQLLVDYVPGAEQVTFRGKITGLGAPGTKDKMAVNAAIVFDPRRLELDGRIQIVQVSSKDLRALMDMIDPYREDAAMNSVRRALTYGYPKQVNIDFAQGLMSMKVDLGGLFGSLIKVGKISGVALGPFMNRHVAPFLPW